VEGITLRLLPWNTCDGPHNMAADEVMLHSIAADHIASLRFYGWTPATLSLGYFQPAAARLMNPLLAGLPWVRRPTGGATLVHDCEVTYALALPPGEPWQAGEPWMPRMHRIIAEALTSLGVQQRLALVERPTRSAEVLCFQQHTPGDLVCGSAKIVGSAQRKQRRVLLQHGGILLARSRHTPQLPGLRELSGVTLAPGNVEEAIVAAFKKATGWTVTRGNWTEKDERQIDLLANEKYCSAAWNEKR
jgi:lipoyl(octanoyl) transferase